MDQFLQVIDMFVRCVHVNPVRSLTSSFPSREISSTDAIGSPFFPFPYIFWKRASKEVSEGLLTLVGNRSPYSHTLSLCVSLSLSLLHYRFCTGYTTALNHSEIHINKSKATVVPPKPSVRSTIYTSCSLIDACPCHFSTS